MVHREGFGRSLCLAVDARGYGGAGDLVQQDWQAGLIACLDEAAAGAGLHRDTWLRQAKGDEEFAVLPPAESEQRVVDDFVRELVAALNSYNRVRQPPVRLRLRMAVHYGVTLPGQNGVPGPAAVTTSRLLNSDVAHAALTNSDAPLALVLSDGMYQDVVAPGHTTLSPTDFRAVVARCKEFGERAWLRVPGVDVHGLDLSEQPDTASGEDEPVTLTATGGERPRSITFHQKADQMNVFGDRVDATHAQFGPVYQQRGPAADA